MFLLERLWRFYSPKRIGATHPAMPVTTKNWSGGGSPCPACKLSTCGTCATLVAIFLGLREAKKAFWISYDKHIKIPL
jgi:hypothetical protein